MARRGLTLVELLAALALVLVISALVMPAFQGRLDEARFDSGKRQIEAAVMVCRAESQRQGRALALSVRPMAAGEYGLFMEPIAAEAAVRRTSRTAELSDSPESLWGSEPADPVEAAGDSGLPTPVWATIPGRVTVSDRPPQEELALAGGDGRAGSVAAGDAQAGRPDTRVVTLAVFFPDGSAASRGPVYVISGPRVSTVSINRWTGAVAFGGYTPAVSRETVAEDTPMGLAAERVPPDPRGGAR